MHGDLELELSSDPKSSMSLVLQQTTINKPIIVHYPQSNYVKRDDILSKQYPSASRLRKLQKTHAHLFSNRGTYLDILKLRINLQAYLKEFDSAARDIWKQDLRMLRVFKIIMEHTFPSVEVKDQFKLSIGKDQSREFKLAVESPAILVRLDKRMVKEAMVALMEDLRFFARARNIDEVWGVATSLYEWQVVWYSKHREIN